MASTYDRIYDVIARIPRGRVATYGQVAELAGLPRAARQVGYALAALHDDPRGVPWHRVIGRRSKTRGRITILDPMGATMQRMRLEAEGVVFDEIGQVSLERFGWPKEDEPKATKKAAGKGRQRR